MLTTHDMTEVERLAERVILINGGRIVFDGDIDALRRTHAEAADGAADLEDVMRRAFGDRLAPDALDAAIDTAAQP